MGPWGAVIMGFFGGVFFAAACVVGGGWREPLLVVPVVVFVGIGAMARRRIARAAPGGFGRDARTRRIIRWATIAEGVGIAVVSAGFGVSGHPSLVLPGIAAVVGLHFLPMGYGIPFRPFAVIAWLLLLAAGIGMVMRPPDGAVLAGGAAAVALWVAAGLALGRGVG
jgi:hypothetical protein